MYKAIRSYISNKLDNQFFINSIYAEYIIWLPDLLHLIYKLSFDERVNITHKIKFYSVLIYIISPLDLLPESIFGPIGYLDDFALIIYVLNEFINSNNEKILLEYWQGKENILTLIKNILKLTSDTLFDYSSTKFNKHT